MIGAKLNKIYTIANGNFATPIKKPTAAKASRKPLNVSLLDENINFVLN